MDEFTLDIVRPDTDEPVPVIMVQSPYWEFAGRGREGETKQRNDFGVVVSMPLFYDNWFVPRGYAFVALDAPGNGTGGGCDDNFGPGSTASATAALDWLAQTTPANGGEGADVMATWSDGNVAMIGKSADGGLAVAAAATGHPALKAIVPIAGVTGSLERATNGGVLSGPVPGEDWYGADCEEFAGPYIDAWGDGFTYTDFWRERDPTVDMSAYSAATFIVSGFNDYNVPTSQAKLLWDALVEHDAPRKMWLHQAGHVDPFDVRREQWVATLSKFFDHYLRGDANGVEDDPAVTIQNTDESWTDLATWPPPPATTTAWGWQDGVLTAGATPETDSVDPIGVVRRNVSDVPSPDFEGNVDFWLGDLTKPQPYRFMVTSEPLSEPMTIRGEPTITGSFQLTGDRYGIVATLIDLGRAPRIDPDDALSGHDVGDAPTESCWGASLPYDDACYVDTQPIVAPTEYGIVANGGSGIERDSFRDEVEPVPNDQWTTATIRLGMANTTIPAGHRLAVVFTSSVISFRESLSTRTVTIGSDLVVHTPET